MQSNLSNKAVAIVTVAGAAAVVVFVCGQRRDGLREYGEPNNNGLVVTGEEQSRERPGMREERDDALEEKKVGLPESLAIIAEGGPLDAGHLLAAIEAWSSEHEKAGVKLVLTREDRMLLSELGRAVADTGIDAVADLLAALPEFSLRVQVMQAAAPIIAMSPDKAMSLLQSIGRDRGLGQILAREMGKAKVASDGGEAAVAWAESFSAEYDGDTSVGNAVVKGALEAWAKEDPAAVLDWSATHQSIFGDTAAAGKLCRQLAAGNPAQAVAFASELPDSAEKTRTLRYTILKWAAGDRAAAISWIDQFSDRKGQQLTQVAIAESWGREDPQRALEWVASWESADEIPLAFRNEIAERIATDWAARDSAASDIYLNREDENGPPEH